MSMDFKRLANFVAVVEHGTLGRAAKTLFVAQPALTRQLQLLEEDVGVQLLKRSARGVRPTAAGSIFLRGARKLLADYEETKRAALRASQGEEGSLAVGVSDIYSWHPTVASAVRAFKTRFPAVGFNLAPLLSGEIVARVLSGDLDCGFVLMTSTDARLKALPVLRDGLSLAVHRQSPLAAHPPRNLRQLAGADLILSSRAATPWLFDLLIHACHRRGLTPRVAHEGATHSAVLALVAAGMGCALLPDAVHLRRPDDVLLLKLSDLKEELQIQLVWRDEDSSPTIARFVEVVREHRAG